MTETCPPVPFTLLRDVDVPFMRRKVSILRASADLARRHGDTAAASALDREADEWAAVLAYAARAGIAAITAGALPA